LAAVCSSQISIRYAPLAPSLKLALFVAVCAPATPEQADIAEPRHHRPRAEPSVAALMAPKLYRVTLGTSVSTDASVGVA
jgi:hypothetical protein